MRREVCAVIGAQYGSEGKGRIVQEIANEYSVHVRTGGPNAGHTIHHGGRKWKMQVLPCGWINPDALLMIGPGAVLDCEQLWREVDEIESAGYSIRDRLHIDYNASILTREHHEAEGGVDGEGHKRIGSTGHGVGACRAARMARGAVPHLLAADMPELGLYTADVAYLLSFRTQILLEGTQGTGLSMTHGSWPYVTSADTTAGQFLVDAGLPPSALTRCILVARTYPIRVAGNSGPLNKEIDWDVISERMGRPMEERTTVTSKVRRIAQWDETLFLRSVMLNDPTEIALTFMDYFAPQCEGVDNLIELMQSVEAASFIDYVESVSERRVKFVGTGGKEEPCLIRV